MRGQPIVYQTLERLGIRYEGMEHDPVFTIDEMRALDMPADVEIAKNLFLRDAKGKRHFLAVLPQDKPAALRDLEEKIGSTRLSFASEDRLRKHLGLPKGAVSPLGVLNDADNAVEVLFDAELERFARIGVHPNDNTATLFMAFGDIVGVVRDHGNRIDFI